MTLMYLTACDKDGRDCTILLDVARIAAIAPYAEPSHETLWLSNSHRPRNREYLRIVMGSDQEYVVLASEWPRLKQMLTRLNGGGFNRFGNDTDELEQPRYLPSASSPRHEERVESYPPEVHNRRDDPTIAVGNTFDDEITELAARATEAHIRRCVEAIPTGCAANASEGETTCSSSR